MEASSVMEASTIDPKLVPNDKEWRAIRLFVSKDETRPSLATLWQYTSDGGVTYVATDGHTMAVRRSGTHRTMALDDIRRLKPVALDEVGRHSEPPRWDPLLRAGTTDKPAKSYGINPHYVARVGEVEIAAGKRTADDFVPPTGMSAKEAKQKKANYKIGAFATWIIPSDPLDGWFWRLETPQALWEGVIMPRRV